MLKIDFNTEEVNKHIAEQIMQSVIGNNMSQVIEEYINEMLTSDKWMNPIRRLVEVVLIEYAREVMSDEKNKNKIQEKMKNILASELSDELMDGVCINMSAKVVQAMKNI